MKKKNVHNLKWATAHLSRRLGAGRWGAQAWALGWALGERACGRRWACVGERSRQLGAPAPGAAGAQACGVDGARGRQGARVAGAQDGRCAGGRRSGVRGMRGRARGRDAAGRAELAGHKRCARGHARPGRGLGAGWVCWLGQLG